MINRRIVQLAALCVCVVSAQARISGQVAEVVGSRALGMGGAFVAVASDSSATWWNPAGLGAGPFVDVALARAFVESTDDLPAWREKSSWFALGTPVIGVSYYRFRITDIQRFGPIEEGGLNREDRRVEVPVRSLSVSHLGLTLVQTLSSGVHAGATLKYVRGTVVAGLDDGLALPAEVLSRAEERDEGDAEGRFDVDVGVLAVAGPIRLGARMRNVREPEFGGVRFDRHTRVGVAYDAAQISDVPLTIAFDADVGRYTTASGERRVVAVGAEQWLWAKRLGLRGGARVNTAGAGGRSATAGASVLLRAGVYVDGHVVRGGTADEKGWGVATRVSF